MQRGPFARHLWSAIHVWANKTVLTTVLIQGIGHSSKNFLGKAVLLDMGGEFKIAAVKG